MTESLQFHPHDAWLIIGLGRSGLATLEVLATRGVRLYATDDQPRAALQEAIATAESYGAQFVEPGELDAILPAITWAVLSPGVPPISPVVRALNARNVPVMGEIELAYRLCPAPIIAVTGTKGKSTTTALLGHLLRSCGRGVRVGGNIGTPLITEVSGVTAGDWVVAEVSSFQLETIRSFKPRVAVLLNIAPDHLDRYPSMDEYEEAKFRIFANQSFDDWFVGFLDNPRIGQLAWHRGSGRIPAHQLWYSLRSPQHAAMYLRDGHIFYAPVSGDPRPIALLETSDIPLPGKHNVQNVMAALLAGIAAGCDPRQLAEAVKSFSPLHHRLETVAELDGVLYVDDSKATNPEAVMAALRSYSRPVVLIAGGRAKNSSFDILGSEIRGRVKALVTIGESGPQIARVATGVPTASAASMDEAVAQARRFAAPGDVVLLSPGCASFDMFDSAEDRGRRFSAAVTRSEQPANA